MWFVGSLQVVEWSHLSLPVVDDASVVNGEPRADVRNLRVPVVDACESVSLSWVGGGELPLLGVASDARGRASSLGGWRCTCECDITSGAA